MPMAIPIIAGAMSISAGIAATGIIGGMMIAGGAMTIVGAVTKNQKLMKIGGILSAVGGLANLASNAINGASAAAGSEVAAEVAAESTLGAGEATAGMTMDGADLVAPELTSTEIVGKVPGLEASGSELAGATQGAAGSAAPVDALDQGLASRAGDSAGAAAADAGSVSAPSTGSIAAPSVQSVSAPTAPQVEIPGTLSGSDYGTMARNTGMAGPGTIAAQDAALAVPPQQPGLLDKFMTFGKDNPGLTQAMGQGLMGMGQGYMQGQAAEDMAARRRAEELADREQIGKSLLAVRMARFQPRPFVTKPTYG